MTFLKSLLAGGGTLALTATGALAEPALIFDLGGKFDKSFNEAAFAGAQRWVEETGGTYKELEMQSEAQREQALLGSLQLAGVELGLGHRRVPLADRHHDLFGQVDHPALTLLTLAPPLVGHLPRRTPRLLLDRLLTHPVLTRVDMDSDSHLRQIPVPVRSPPAKKPSEPTNLDPSQPVQLSQSEPDAPAVTDAPQRPPRFPRPPKCHTPLAFSVCRIERTHQKSGRR